MNESKQALKFGLGAGLLGVLCCVGPLIPILIGVGGASALFGLDQYKPVFIGIGLVFLAGSSWYLIRKRNKCCMTVNRMKDAQIVLLIFSVGIGSYFALQYWVVPSLSEVASNKIANQQEELGTHVTLSNLEIEIEGMTCAGCAVGIEQALLEVYGVASAKINWEIGLGNVEYDRNRVNPEEILNAKVHDQYVLKIKTNDDPEKSDEKVMN